MRRLMVGFFLNVMVFAGLIGDVFSQSDPGASVVATPALEVTRVVEVEGGKITGLVVNPGAGIEAFRGIPFAAPPVGALRWREPQAVVPWEGVRECNTFGNASLQVLPKLPIKVPGFDIEAPTSEDCLYLNVWSPSRDGKGKLPVLVWIHGGGYVIGSASQPLYNGEPLAGRGVVVVTINYRLGALGFMAHAALSAESPRKASGNYGIMDQIAALKWVQKNIAQFGGDPGNVTIFGESAGGGSVYALLVSPEAKGLFHRALAQSGPIMNLKHLREPNGLMPAMESIGQEVVEKLGLGDRQGAELAGALRAVPAEKLMEVSATSITSLSMNVREDLLRWAPIVDGYIIPDRPNRLFASGRFNKVPVMIGSNKDEGTMFTMLNNPIKTPEDFDRLLVETAPAHVETLRKHYPAGTLQEAKASLNTVVRNLIFTLQARLAARMVSKAGVPVYLYQFTYVSPAGLGKMMGAHHGAEIPYVFNNPGTLNAPGGVDARLAETISGYVIAFAKSGNPNHGDAPPWPQYNARDDVHMDWGETIKPSKRTLRSCHIFRKSGSD